MAKIVQPHFRRGTIVGVIRACTLTELGELVALDAGWLDCGPVWLCLLTTGSKGVDGAGRASYLLPGDESWVADKYLRPIRDPGDDAKDEMLRPLPREVAA